MSSSTNTTAIGAPRRTGVLLGVGVGVLALAYLGLDLFMDRPAGGSTAWLDVWFYDALLGLAAVVAFIGARRSGRGRGAWHLSAAALLCTCLGDLTWTLLFGDSDVSPGDGLFLSFYPLMYAAIMLLVRQRVGRRHAGQWLDGAIAGCGVAAIVAAILFPPLVAAASGGPLVVAVNLAYPVADVLLIAVILAGLAPLGWRPDRPLALLLAGLAINTVGDVVYLLQSAAGSEETPRLANALFVTAVLTIAGAPFCPTRTAARRGDRHLSMLLLPAASAAAALALVIVSSALDVQPLAVGLASSALVLAGVRVSMAFRELRSLAGSRREARTDELSGLPNRRAFLESVAAGLRRCSEAEPLSLLIMDLDGFKEINDTLGHQSGDQLLVAVGALLQAELGTAGVVARIGGDEFAVLLPDTDADAARATADALRRAIDRPHPLGDMAVTVHASIGVSTAPLHGSDTSSLLRFADIAMYEAKNSRCGVTVYDVYKVLPADRRRERLQLAHDIGQGIERGEIVLHYQPKVEIATGRVHSCEALARWQHPVQGLVFPDVFLPLVEQRDLGSALTRAVISTAVRQLAVWQRRGVTWTVAVNISPPDLLDESLPDFVAHLLRQHAVDAGRLVLEITEGSLVTDPVRAGRTVRRLREAGTQISLDDFGVGFSSLVHLRTLELDELKLDRALAVGLDGDRRGQSIVRAAVSLADALGLRLIVEGIEHEAERDLVAGLGAQYVQGYFYSRPLCAADLETWAERSVQPAVAAAAPHR